MSGSEFQLIQKYFLDPQDIDITQRDDVLLGIGDDCAIVQPKPGKQIVFSLDTLNSGVHFPHNTSADAIAHKALTVNLSDLAAMGAQPNWFTLGLSLPGADHWSTLKRQQWLDDFSSSLFSLAKTHNIQLIGGDTTHGPLSISIQICGYIESDKALLRSNAQCDDIIVVTGALGAASLGLDIALQQNSHYYEHLSNEKKQIALDALNYPQAKVSEALLLSNHAHAAIDISDGLIADLGHILKASQCGATLYLEKIPLSPVLSSLPKKIAWQKALSGGDEYQLCFCISQQKWQAIKNQLPDSVEIGYINNSLKLTVLTEDGQDYLINSDGYNHFS